jgi:hypothetical protein
MAVYGLDCNLPLIVAEAPQHLLKSTDVILCTSNQCKGTGRCLVAQTHKK